MLVIGAAIIFWVIGVLTGLAFADDRPQSTRGGDRPELGGTPQVTRPRQSPAPTRPGTWSK